jgi:predicted ABC-type ATPase
VFAGPNGAGKSALVGRFKVAGRMPLINPDDIAHDLNPDDRDTPAAMLKAGRIATVKRRMLIQNATSFAMETTLTGHSELRLMANARVAGYKITLVYVGVADALTSLARVRERVARGGHNVSTAIIFRRYGKSLANVPDAIGLADRTFILDNSGSRHRLLMTIDEGHVRHRTHDMPNWALGLVATVTKL